MKGNLQLGPVALMPNMFETELNNVGYIRLIMLTIFVE